MSEQFKLSYTLDRIKGPTKEHIIVLNQYATTAIRKYHSNSDVDFEFNVHGEKSLLKLVIEDDFQSSSMKEKKDIANFGAVAMTFFMMSVLLDYSYVEQSEIGDGVDYVFSKDEPTDDDLNFLNGEHYVEISGILEEKGSNTLQSRINTKHKQINKGLMSDKNSSVVITLFEKPVTTKIIHHES